MDVKSGLLSSEDSPYKNSSLENDGCAESSPEAPKTSPMAFTIDFGGGKSFDKSRLEHLAKQSQARHQRVHSMSGNISRTSPTALTPQKPPLSAKLPRKAQGYNSEGYFSSDQEDNLNGSIKIKPSPLSQRNDFKAFSISASPSFDKRQIKSPMLKSRSPIVDNIMSTSDIFPSRESLNLPLKNTYTGSYQNLNHNFNYSNRQLNSIVDQSPEGVLLADISSPEFDMLTPDNPIPSPENKSLKREVPDLFKKCMPKSELEILEDADKHSEGSSTGTYTIEADYSEEQKARMSIDRTFGVDLLQSSITESLQRRSLSRERDPELIIDSQTSQFTNKPSDLTPKPSEYSNQSDFSIKPSDKNMLELNCYHDAGLSEQTSKQIKSTRNYLEKIKSRVRTISEKTFQKKPSDEGSFTSVTACGVLAKSDHQKPRRISLSKSTIDQTDYVHRLTRESSVPISLNTPSFESTVLKNAQAKLLDDSGIANSPDAVVGKLSYLSLNRCKGDQNWIRDWAESVDKYSDDREDLDAGFSDRPPMSPRHQKNNSVSLRSMVATNSKIPSPLTSSRHSPRQEAPLDTSLYLQNTQIAITNLQAKLTRKSPESIGTLTLTTSLSDRTKLPISQLSRSNSLNYRLKRRDPGSPLKSPGRYVITGSDMPNRPLCLTSRSFDSSAVKVDNSPNSDKTNASDITLSQRTYAKHTRHKSDGKNADFRDTVDLKTVLKNNAFELQNRIEPSRGCYGDANQIKKSSSIGTMNVNHKDVDLSDESDCLKTHEVRYNRTMALRRERLMAPDVKKCPNTPEIARKFTAVRPTVRAVKKETQEQRRDKTPAQRKISESTRAEVFNRLTKSRSSTRETQPKRQDKASDLNRQRCCSSLARDLNYANFKRRTTYDPMKAARRSEQSPCHSSPVHRSQSFHSTNLADLDMLGYSSEDEQEQNSAAIDPMVTSTHSEILRPTLKQNFHIKQPEKKNRRDIDKRKTYIVDDRAIDNRSIDNRSIDTRTIDTRTIDKRGGKLYIDEDDRKTFILDSDTNSTTNASSPRNSSIFSHEKVSLTTGPSDTDGESGPESAPVMRSGRRANTAPANRRSGDYSMSSSATSVNQKSVQPRYLDITRYKGERHKEKGVNHGKGSAGSIESEQKKAALEKWKRRASYDPRKSATADKAARQPVKTVSNVYRSQSFHGPVAAMSRCVPTRHIPECGDGYGSDNDF